MGAKAVGAKAVGLGGRRDAELGVMAVGFGQLEVGLLELRSGEATSNCIRSSEVKEKPESGDGSGSRAGSTSGSEESRVVAGRGCDRFGGGSGAVSR